MENENEVNQGSVQGSVGDGIELGSSGGGNGVVSRKGKLLLLEKERDDKFAALGDFEKVSSGVFWLCFFLCFCFVHCCILVLLLTLAWFFDTFVILNLFLSNLTKAITIILTFYLHLLFILDGYQYITRQQLLF